MPARLPVPTGPKNTCFSDEPVERFVVGFGPDAFDPAAFKSDTDGQRTWRHGCQRAVKIAAAIANAVSGSIKGIQG